MGGERWSWRAGVPAEFSSNPNQTHLKRLIKVFRMQLGIFFPGFFRVGAKLCRRVALQDQRSPPLVYKVSISVVYPTEMRLNGVTWSLIFRLFSSEKDLHVSPLKTMYQTMLWFAKLLDKSPFKCQISVWALIKISQIKLSELCYPHSFSSSLLLLYQQCLFVYCTWGILGEIFDTNLILSWESRTETSVNDEIATTEFCWIDLKPCTHTLKKRQGLSDIVQKM